MRNSILGYFNRCLSLLVTGDDKIGTDDAKSSQDTAGRVFAARAARARLDPR